MVFSHSTPSSRPRPPRTKNTSSQPSAWTIQPISGANSAVARYCAELAMAVAVARSPAGNQAAMIRALPGKHGAPAKPTSRRSRNRVTTAQASGSAPVKPCSRVNSDQPNRAMA
ncbi:hypothetical protein D3C78_1728430 [compost metagenome]